MKTRRVVTATIVSMVAALAVAGGVPQLRSVTFGWLPSWRSTKPRTVVLLVHGMTWQHKERIDIWGSHVGKAPDRSHWNGMIGFLEDKAGYRFGGAIRATGSAIALPDCLDAKGVRCEPREANLFALEFSTSANTDGLSYKTEELAACLNALREFTGATRVRLVAHSAGGLVCRTLMQSALPVAEYEPGSVDRLITIATPHLGAAIASNLGDLLGTRATSLKPEAALIRRLNTTLDLPADADYASLVVRGIAADLLGDGEDYRDLANASLLSKLPVNYRQGGDQVTHVKSQNLRLAACAARFEQQTARPVHGILVRVADPTPDDLSPFQTTVHVVAPRNAEVQAWVARLLADDCRFWSGLSGEELAEQARHHAEQTAFACIEKQALEGHRLSEVYAVEVETVQLTEVVSGQQHWRFCGRAKSQGRSVLRGLKHVTRVAGTMVLSCDQSGRIADSRTAAAVVARE